MNLFKQHLRIFPRNWKLGLVVLFISAFFLLPVAFTEYFGGNSWWFILAYLSTAGINLGFFVGETQKEMMSRGTGFLLPNLERTVISVQVLFMVILGFCVFLLAFLLPSLAPVTTGNFMNSLGLSFLVMACFSTTLLIDLLFKYSAYLTSTVMMPYFLLINYGKNAEPQIYSYWLGHSGILFMVCALVIVLSFRTLLALSLSRRLAEQPYLSSLQLYQADRVQNFKNQIAAHKPSSNQDGRPLKNTMTLCLEKASQARFAGRESLAILWDTLHLNLATTVPRHLFGLGLYILFILLFVLIIGYVDSKAICRSDESMIGWFGAFPFIFSTTILTAFHFLATRPIGLSRSRAATEKAGYAFFLWAAVGMVVLSLATLGLLHFLSAVMPEIETTKLVWSYSAPSRPHVPFLPIMIMPLVLVAYLLWPRTNAQMVLGGAGMQAFILLHGLMTMGGYGWPLLLAVGISLSAWIALPLLWKRRVRVGV